MINERLEKLRVQRGISKAELCRQIKMPQTTYSGYALGTREPDIETINLFAKYYNVSVDFLISGNDGGEFQKGLDKFVEDFIGLNKDDQETIKSLIERMKEK